MKRISFLFIIAVIAACQNYSSSKRPASQDSVATTNQKDRFNTYLEQFPEIKLPITINGCETEPGNRINPEISADYNDSQDYIYAKFKSNGNYIGVITLAAADCFLPQLTTFKLNGEKIDSQTIAIGGCDDGPCYECKEVMVLKENFTLYVADTMKAFDCDDEYNIIEGTEKTTVAYRKGRLTKEGKIELSEEFKE